MIFVNNLEKCSGAQARLGLSHRILCGATQLTVDNFRGIGKVLIRVNM